MRSQHWRIAKTVTPNCMDSPSNVGGTQIGAVHQTDTVHGAEGEHQAAINAVHDAALLLVGEAGDARVFVAWGVFGGILVVDGHTRLLHIRASLAILAVMAIDDDRVGDLGGAVGLLGEKPFHGGQVAVSTLSGV
jgi:hypothetical protein